MGTPFTSADQLIGKTPLLELTRLEQKHGLAARILAKVEAFQPAGSVKDRVAKAMLDDGEAKGLLTPGTVIIEPTSGNTGIALAALAAARGYRLILVMPETMSVERRQLMKAYGAELVLTEGAKGMKGALAKVQELAAAIPNHFLPRQFENPVNAAVHQATTGPEIWADTAGAVDLFVAGVGTGGTIMGLARRLREENPACRAYPLEPLSSPTLSTGYKVGSHRIQGISDEFIPDLLHLDALDEVVSVDDGDALIMARMLSEQLGLGVGVSSGANFVGCVMKQEALGGEAVMVTTFADDNKKYLSTDYAEPQPMRDGYVTKDLELTGVVAHRL